MNTKSVQVKEKKTLERKLKLRFDEWLAVSWSLYWRYLIGLFCMFVLVFIFSIASTLLLQLIMGASPGLYFEIIDKTLIISVFLFFFIIVNVLVLKWFFCTEFNGFRIGIISNTEPDIEISINKRDWLKVFWSFIWRSIILTIGIFIIILLSKLCLGAFLFKSEFLKVIVPRTLDYQILSIEVFVNAIGFYIGFLSNILLIKWLFSLKNRKYKLVFVKLSKNTSRFVRNSLLSVILVIFFIGGILNAFINFFAFDFFKENIPYVFLYSHADSIVFSILSIAMAIFVIPVWCWKKWGVYFFIITFLISIIGCLLLRIGLLMLMPSIITYFLFIYLVKKQWNGFG
jgi:hypothetical protein